MNVKQKVLSTILWGASIATGYIAARTILRKREEVIEAEEVEIVEES